MTTITPVIMVGGAGTRLWPLSRQAKPKQFHALTGGGATLFQTTAHRVSGGVGDVQFAPPVVVCAEAHVATVMEQLGEEDIGRLVLEPVGRSTAACAVVAAALGGDLILLLPSDHLIADTEAFRRTIAEAAPAAQNGALVIFGVRPTRAETGYGYIECRGEGSPRPVISFKEKPDAETAASYVAEGRYFWNAGIFLMRSDRLLEEMQRFRPDIHAAALKAVQSASGGQVLRLEPGAFAECPTESLDRAVMEQTRSAVMAPLQAGWSDIGGFDALWEAAQKDEDGNAGDPALLLDVRDSLIRTDGPVVAVVGLSEVCVIVQDGAVLVAKLDRAQDVKKVTERLRLEGRAEAL